MRGGAIPLIAWALLNLALLIGDWIWQGTNLGVAMTGFTVLIVNAFAAAFWLIRRDAIHKGPPERRSEPEPLPRISLAAAGAGASVAVILFGLVFGKFLLFIGGALALLSLGRLGRELIWQQRTMSEARRYLAAGGRSPRAVPLETTAEGDRRPVTAGAPESPGR